MAKFTYMLLGALKGKIDDDLAMFGVGYEESRTPRLLK